MSGSNVHILSGLFSHCLRCLATVPSSLLSFEDDTVPHTPPPVSNNHHNTTTTNNINNNLISPWRMCVNIINNLQELGMAVTPEHVSSAIRISSKEGRYKRAAYLFQNRLIGANAGIAPVDPTLGRDEPLELGLFAVAKVAQQARRELKSKVGEVEEASDNDDIDIEEKEHHVVSRRVFDAALELRMVSPRDKDTYILAAISALGRAGEWQACVDYLSTKEGKEIGQPLVAAVMKACLENDQGQAALAVYHDLVHKNEGLFALSEWQTSGNFETVLSACRDLALRSFRHVVDDEDDDENTKAIHAEALDIFKSAVQAGAKISAPAVESILWVCEKSQDWETAHAVFELVLDKTISNNSKRGTSSTTTPLKHQKPSTHPPPTATTTENQTLPYLTNDMVASTMRTCNATQQFGMALFCAHLARLARTQPRPSLTTTKTGDDDTSYLDPNTEQLLRILDISLTIHKGELSSSALLTAAIVSLCGMGQMERAVKLFHVVVSRFNLDPDDDQWTELKEHLKLIRKEHQENHNDEPPGGIPRVDTNQVYDSWDRAFDQIEKMDSALVATGNETSSLPGDDAPSNVVHDRLNSTMKACTQANQPMLGLIIARRIARNEARRSTGISNIPPSLRDVTGEFSKIADDLVTSNDQLLSSTMEAYRKVGRQSEALQLFSNKMKQSDTDTVEDTPSHYSNTTNTTPLFTHWPQSSLLSLRLLLDTSDPDGAYEVFCRLDPAFITDDVALAMARGFVAAERWEDVGDVWRTALDTGTGCLSEELAVLALKSVSYATFDYPEAKFTLFGEIVWEMANFTGMSKEKWRKSQYWTLKKEVLEKDLANLMGWRYGEIKEGEMIVAIEGFHQAISRGEHVPPEILLSIVKQAGYKQRHVRCKGNPVPDRNTEEMQAQQEVERKEGVDMIVEALLEARKTSYGDDPKFTLLVAQGLRALKANFETIEFVKELCVSREGNEIRPLTFLQGVFAAKSLGDQESKNDIINLMEESGVTYEDHEDTFRSEHS